MKYNDRDDGELLRLIAERDREALEALYERYARPVYSMAMHLLTDSGAAEEVTQDVFFKVWRRASSYFAHRGKVTAWLFSIAHHRAIDELRRRRRERGHVELGVDLSNRASDDGNDPYLYTRSQLDSGQVRDALRDLRPEQQEVVVLAYFGGLTHSEIAAKLGQPLGTVKTRMRLALKRLREVLSAQQQTESVDYGL